MQKGDITMRNRKSASPASVIAPTITSDTPKKFSYSIPILGAVLFGIGLLIYLLWMNQHSNGSSSSSSSASSASASSSLIGNSKSGGGSEAELSSSSLNIGPVQSMISNTLVIYQLPSCPLEEIVGIIFMAHGCSHSATDFWPSSTMCPTCIGLPQETKLVSAFLENKFIVVAIDSEDRHSKCWSGRADGTNINKIFTILRQNNKWDYPLFAFGASSGGTMVGHLANEQSFVEGHKLKGIIVQIANINNFRWVRVPVMYNFMEKDTARKEIALKSIHEMRLFFIKTQPSLVPISRESHPLIITEKFFMEHIPNKFDEQLSHQLYHFLMSVNMIDATGYLVKDPRKHSQWRQQLKQADFFSQLKDDLIPDQSPIQEMMNVAYGYHELTAEFALDFVKFCTLIATNKYEGEFDPTRKGDDSVPLKHRENNWRLKREDREEKKSFKKDAHDSHSHDNDSENKNENDDNKKNANKNEDKDEDKNKDDDIDKIMNYDEMNDDNDKDKDKDSDEQSSKEITN